MKVPQNPPPLTLDVVGHVEDTMRAHLFKDGASLPSPYNEAMKAAYRKALDQVRVNAYKRKGRAFTISYDALVPTYTNYTVPGGHDLAQLRVREDEIGGSNSKGCQRFRGACPQGYGGSLYGKVPGSALERRDPHFQVSPLPSLVALVGAV